MAKKVEKLGSAKRFGARYGTKPKHKFAKIEKEHRRRHKCPYCNAVAVKRVSMGIWHCRKCDSKFTGKAYTISKHSAMVQPDEPAVQETMEQDAEESQEEELEPGMIRKQEKVLENG